MLFTEPTFLFVFLPILLALYQLPGVSYRNGLLLAASIIFYTRGAGNFTWLVLAMIVLTTLPLVSSTATVPRCSAGGSWPAP